ncbi:Transcriptional regulator [Microbotryomycetes sp. JL201]|nr:Transcriptional regulator [Microbotryomycetes sp. JL201]
MGPTQPLSSSTSVASSGAPAPLRKFTLHPPSIIGSASPITAAANYSGPYSVQMLTAARQALISARQSAAERHGIRDANRKNLAERQANEKRVAEEQAKQKETDRKRKRDEDERRERERQERIERERVERERDEATQRKKEEEAYQKQMQQEEEAKRIKDEKDRQEALLRAREAKEKKRIEDEARAEEERKHQEHGAPDRSAKVDSVVPEAAEGPSSADVRSSDASQATAAELPLSTDDVKMEDVAAPSQSLAQVPQPAPLRAAVASKAPSAASATVNAMLEGDEDEDQVKVPLRHEKKRKRDHVIDSDASDSDDQPLIAKARKLEAPSSNGAPSASPAVNGTRSASAAPLAPETSKPGGASAGPSRQSAIEKKLQEEKFVKHSIPIKPPAPGTATAFYLPSHSLVPPQPHTDPPEPTPKRQADVTGDFSVAKPGTQIAHHTFHTWAEAYLRPFGEDDLAFLAPKPHDVTPYIIPPLGKHYTEVWEEEDSGLPVASTSVYASPLEPPPLTRTRPENLTEDTSGVEHVTLGPLSERLVAALAFDEGGDDEDSNDDGRENGVSDGTGAVIPDRRTIVDAVELEERIKRELRFIGLLPEDDVDWSLREDDEVSSALRACQRQLYHQTTLNEARKAVLSSIVKDRMAYQDFETARDAQERIIENGWSKRQKVDKKKKSKRERERDRRERHHANASGATHEDHSALTTGKHMSLALLEAMDKRNRLIASLQPLFDDEEEQGRFYGLPEKSVYEGLEEAIIEQEEEDEAFSLL